MTEQVRFRAATADDAEAAVPLIHSSGPAAFEYVFAVPGRGDARDFLMRAFVDGAGEFGWRNHWVGELDGRHPCGARALVGRAIAGRHVRAEQRELVLASLIRHPYPREDRHVLRP